MQNGKRTTLSIETRWSKPCSSNSRVDHAEASIPSCCGQTTSGDKRPPNSRQLHKSDARRIPLSGKAAFCAVSIIFAHHVSVIKVTFLFRASSARAIANAPKGPTRYRRRKQVRLRKVKTEYQDTYHRSPVLHKTQYRSQLQCQRIAPRISVVLPGGVPLEWQTPMEQCLCFRGPHRLNLRSEAQSA